MPDSLVTDVHFANSLGTWLAPVLLAVRATGFFEWYVYMPIMTLLSVPLYQYVVRSAGAAQLFGVGSAWQRRIRRSACYVACFLFSNVLAVALKTLIVEEMDYVTPVWYAPLVSPLHFYIASVLGAYLWMLRRMRRTWFDWVCAGYVQIGLAGGYAVAGYRLVYERWSGLDPTMALGGLMIGVVTLIYNRDVVRRLMLSGPASSVTA